MHFSNRAVQLLFVDTEGFESTGKADVYDDRIFALSALLSSVLVYNLPESIRESDLEKLSFAVELSKAFYGSSSSSSLASSSAAAAAEGGGAAAAAGQQGGDTTPALRPGAMVWLIQRDFLQGKSVGAALAEALAPVPNPHGDPGLTQLNRIRTSLSTLAGNSTALGLPQPHLDRTKLCELGDEALDPGYRTQRDALRELVWAVARPKVRVGVRVRSGWAWREAGWAAQGRASLPTPAGVHPGPACAACPGRRWSRGKR